MSILKVECKGVTPLLMHSSKCVNPLHPLSRNSKVYTSKRNKTDEDYEILSNFGWFMGAYYTNDNIETPWDDVKIDGSEHILYIPAEAIEKTLINGAKKNKMGTAVEKYARLLAPTVPLQVLGGPDFRAMSTSFEYRDVRPMTVQRQKVIRTRPRFNNWGVEFELHYDEDQIQVDVLVNAIDYAGKYVGLLDSRPKYGQFTAKITQVA